MSQCSSDFIRVKRDCHVTGFPILREADTGEWGGLGQLELLHRVPPRLSLPDPAPHSVTSHTAATHQHQQLYTVKQCPGQLPVTSHLHVLHILILTVKTRDFLSCVGVEHQLELC